MGMFWESHVVELGQKPGMSSGVWLLPLCQATCSKHLPPNPGQSEWALNKWRSASRNSSLDWLVLKALQQLDPHSPCCLLSLSKFTSLILAGNKVERECRVKGQHTWVPVLALPYELGDCGKTYCLWILHFLSTKWDYVFLDYFTGLLWRLHVSLLLWKPFENITSDTDLLLLGRNFETLVKYL